MAGYKMSRPVRDEAFTARIAEWENGFRCLHQKTTGGNFIVQLYMNGGAEHFPYGWCGLPHLCEHLATTNVLGISQREFARRIDKLGETHFDTGADAVFFGCETDGRRWRRVLRFFFDTLSACRKGKIDEDALNSQKRVIRHEIYLASSLQDRTNRLFYYTLWPQSSAGQRVHGSLDQLKKFTALHAINYFQESVVGHRLNLGVTGTIPSREIFEFLDPLFGRLPAGEKIHDVRNPKIVKSGIVLRPSADKDAYFVIGQPPKRKRKAKTKYNEDIARQLLVKIVGGLYSSEGYIHASVNGHSYEIEGSVSSSTVRFEGGVDGKDLNAVIENCLGHLFSLARFGPSRVIFDCAKSALLLDEGHFAYHPKSRLAYAVEEMIEEEPYTTYQARCRNIQRITRANVQDYLQRMVHWNKFLLVACGKLQGFRPSARIKRWCGVE